METRDESSEKFIYGKGRGMRGEGMREGFSCSSVFADESAEGGALYTEGFK